jgi:hypothetical protein
MSTVPHNTGYSEYIVFVFFPMLIKGNNKITELRTIL